MNPSYPARVLSLLVFFSIIFYNGAYAQLVTEPYDILLRTEKINLAPHTNLRDVPTDSEIVNGKYYRLVQFYNIPDQALKTKIKNAGIELIDYIPNKAYVASIPADINGGVFADLSIRAISKIKKEWKITTDVASRSFDKWSITGNQVSLSVRYFKDISRAEILNLCADKNIKVLKSPDFIHLLHISIPLERVGEILDMPHFNYFSQLTDPGMPEDRIGRGLHRNNMIDSDYPAGRHYDGTGVNIMVRDDGDVGPHIDFQGRLNNDFSSDVSGTHGDGVAGMAGAAGNLDPRYKGAAKGAFLYILDYDASFLDNTLELHLTDTVMITNSSYSNGCNAGYTEVSETVDLQISENPSLLHVFSGGNSNNLDCDYGAGNQWGNITGGHKQGKNVMTTANLAKDGTLVNSSSRGPAFDGRIKPDIAAHGAEQVSTFQDNEYAPFGGTSAAAPCVMGTASQLYQAYKELNGGVNPESALIKATLLNTANDLENEGPDFRTGWGHLNAYRAVRLLEDQRYLFNIVGQGDSNTHTVTVPPNTKQVRMMLYWSDKESTPMTSKALVNDLNLEVTTPSSEIISPWILDPTADVISLSTPATRGVDNLNNMEQVLINNPGAGDYTLKVDGFEVPFNNVKYYVVYDIVSSDDITVTYPNGGEGFVSNDTERLQWDAFSDQGDFTIDYSLDGGATWIDLVSVPGDTRMYDWTLPEAILGTARLRVTRDGATDSSDANFSIGPVPQNLEVIEACGDFITVSWDKIENATGYEAYLLGDRFMDAIGTTTDTFFTVPFVNPDEDNWIAVRALGPENFAGRRTIAINHNTGYFDCTVDNDIAIKRMITPYSGSYITCSEDNIVSMLIRNNGTVGITDFELNFSLDGGTVVTENYTGTLQPRTEEEYTFMTPLNVNSSGNYLLDTWVEYSLDTAAYNDRAETVFDLELRSSIYKPEIVEAFEEISFPPVDWSFVNNDEGITWERSDIITGPDGQDTRAAFLDNYAYNVSFVEDELISLNIDLTDAVLPELSFDMAYVPYSSTLFDSMRVDVFSDCTNLFEKTIYGKADLELSTLSDYQTDLFVPNSPDQWRYEELDLTEFIGQEIVIKFINISGYGNQMYLDNINIIDLAAPPTPNFNSLPEGCIDVVFEFENISSGVDNTYQWDFGADASTGNATGEGPFSISYGTAGIKMVTLVATNAFGTNTITQEILIKEKPIPSFTYDVDNSHVTFTNTSENCQSYLWMFGDGSSSTLENPLNSYVLNESYTVFLTGQSENCEDVSEVQSVEITTDVKDNILDFNIALFPNPNSGNFSIEFTNLNNQDIQVSLISVTGMVLDNQRVNNVIGSSKLEISKELTAGVYFIKLVNDNKSKVLKVLVQ